MAVAAESDSFTFTARADAVNPNTLRVQTQDGSVETVQLIGVAPYAADERACGASQAAARMQELLDGNTLTLEVDSTTDASHRLAYVWMPDGQNLAGLLIREGDLPAAGSNQAHPQQGAFAAAQAAAIEDKVGIWAPGACRGPAAGSADGTVDPAGLESFVTSSLNAVERARLAIGVLRDQARSAPLVASTPGWQATTATALGWLRQAALAAQAPARGGGPANLIREDLVQQGRELQDTTDRYAMAVDARDLSQLQELSARLSQTADALARVLAELNWVKSAYALGD
ncbi:MAG: thermonuclease family protein [Chloroflexota bacterium]|nr:thermonuclease family protein [Chloroflexota bacterium]